MGKVLASGVISSSLAPNCLSAVPTVDRVLDLCFLGVSPPWQGKGVAKLFLSES